jgi:putative ABC transport system permease protein
MLRHNLLLIYRNARRSRTTFIINLAGLSAGLAAAILICLWVMDELNIDKFHEKDQQLFEVMMNINRPDGIETTNHTPGLTAKTLLEQVPEVENAVGTIQPPMQVKGIISFEGKSVKAHETFVGKEFFQLFSYKLMYGSRDHVLSDRNIILISDDLAIKLFGTADDIVGKAIEWNRGQFTGTYTISGIFERVPENSTVQFDILFNYDLFIEKNSDWMMNWSNSTSTAYVLLKKGASLEQVNQKIADIVSSRDGGSNNRIFLRPYSDQHLYNTYENGMLAGGRIVYIKLFSTIASFILIIACINFMNLSTARASRRIKEIGVRKTVGASRKTLIYQHLGESLIMAFIALIVAALVVDLLLPQFNIITGKHISLNFDLTMLLSFCVIALITGLVSGSYPALYLSGFNPAVVLKGKLLRSWGEQWTRKGLVVFQFAISVILITCVIATREQLEFIQSKNLGYKRDNILYFANEGPMRQNLESFLAELRNIPAVVDASDASFDLAGEHATTYSIRWEGKTPDDSVSFVNLEADHGIVEMLQLEMKTGRSFLRESGSESSNIIINEIAADIIGFSDPIGKTVTIWGKEKQIIGVVRNFHFESLYEKVKPCFIQWSTNKRKVLVKLAETKPETVSAIQHIYQKYNQGFPFEYQFFDEDYRRLYTSEERVAVLARYFAFVAIIISCLGLFALASFTAERRQKEIGIRKLLGSGEMSIVLLLSSDFIRTVLIAIIIALPVSYLIVSDWLDNFAFRAPLQWWYFIGAGTSVLLVAWFTIGTQAIRAATTNPAKYLRDE